MKKNINKEKIFLLIIICFFFIRCSKIQSGFISPTMQYSTNLLIIPKGQIVNSVTLTTDGSSTPISATWLHIYDSMGNIVDTIFKKGYPGTVWKQGFNPKTDTTFADVESKIATEDIQPIEINPLNGEVSSTSSSLNIPSGNYTIDIQISNKVGTQIIRNAMTLQFVDASPIETNDGTAGAPLVGIALAGTATVTYPFYPNGPTNCPFLQMDINRFADTPNVLYLKVVDRNGMPFNPKTGEIFARPGAGLNPIPPYLQNLQQYAPDTYEISDTAMFTKYPIVPFPITSLGNSYLMYYNIKTSSVIIDSTSLWSSNPNYDFYQGVTDSHYKGTYLLNKYDFSLRIPLRIQVPGSYIITEKILCVTHR